MSEPEREPGTSPEPTAAPPIAAETGHPKEQTSPTPAEDERTLPGLGPTTAAITAPVVAVALVLEKQAEEIDVQYAGRTDTGLVREHNEDNFLVADLSTGKRGIEPAQVDTHKIGDRGTVFAVCDGMGGAAAGEVASQMAVDTVFELMRAFSPPADQDAFARRLLNAIEEAGNRIFSAAKMDRARRGMGTTSTVAGLWGRILFVGQVGDSRAYVLRSGELHLVTKDQSLVNQLIEAGQLTADEAEAFEHSNIILQALGTTPANEILVDLTFLEMRRGDRLMLCSDGLSGLVHHDSIKDVLMTESDLAACCAKLIELARAGGGHDNITVVCAEINGSSLTLPDASIPPAYQQYPLPPAPIEDEDTKRQSVPPRSLRIKEGGPKPGSDVKGESPDPPDDAEPLEKRPTANRWPLIALVLVVAIVIIALLLSRSFPSLSPPVHNPRRAAHVGTAGPRLFDVHVRSDVGSGELYVDGLPKGRLSSADTTTVRVPAGLHRFEVRSADSTVVSEEVTVTSEPLDVALNLPQGVEAAAPDELPAPWDSTRRIQRRPQKVQPEPWRTNPF